MSKNNSVEHMTVDDIKKNQTAEADFDFDAVESLDFETVVKARLYQDQMHVLGGIAIPGVQLNLPIIKGVSNFALSVGAGTMKPDQEMGKGNYGLASHRMLDDTLLFSPLLFTSKGDYIYLTDLEYIYTYTITFLDYLPPNRTDMIEDKEGKTLITLVTCDETGAKRFIVQGEFKEKTPVKKATTHMTEAFNLKKNTIN